jgi:hypothetical protein
MAETGSAEPRGKKIRKRILRRPALTSLYLLLLIPTFLPRRFPRPVPSAFAWNRTIGRV